MCLFRTFRCQIRPLRICIVIPCVIHVSMNAIMILYFCVLLFVNWYRNKYFTPSQSTATRVRKININLLKSLFIAFLYSLDPGGLVWLRMRATRVVQSVQTTVPENHATITCPVLLTGTAAIVLCVVTVSRVVSRGSGSMVQS